MIHFTNQLGPFIEQFITIDQMTMSFTVTSLLSREIQIIVNFTKNASPIDEDGFQTVALFCLSHTSQKGVIRIWKNEDLILECKWCSQP